ncbi:MAG: hypothetical protein IAG13_14685 [Deltaproteobacteria bacterium]|nr:hypothetical protein [Nannocystaceae bacterium]
MHRSVCVVFDRPRFARKAYRALSRSSLGAKAESLSVHYRRMVDGKLQVSQTRPMAGALWGGLAMAGLGAVISLFAFGLGEARPMSPWMAMMMGAIFGGGFGALAGALVGTTEPEKKLTDAEPSMGDGHAAVVAEFDDASLADAAERLLLHHDGAMRAT